MRFFLCFLLMGFTVTTHAETALSFGYGDYQSPPYVMKNRETGLPHGIMVDIGKTLTTIVPYKLNLINVPRKRLETYLADGTIDLRCHMSPNWVKAPEQFIWSEPLYSLDTVVLTNVGFDGKINSYADMRGLVFAVIHGYRYSEEFNSLIEFGLSRKLETYSLESAILMLSKGRVDAVVANNVLSKYLIAQRDLQEKIKLQPFVLRSQPIHCAISRQTQVDAQALEKALQEMKSKGAFDNIIKRYFEPVNLANTNMLF